MNSVLQVMKKPFDKLPVDYFRIMHELRKFVESIGNI